MRYIFFATGLPRSRTAWLANWFTTDHSICWHDTAFSVEAVEASNKSFVGFSGPELVAQFGDIQKQHPLSPWLMVLRNEGEALSSFKQFVGDLLPQDDILEKFWRERCHAISMICSHANVVTCQFEDLEKEDKCREIWARMLPDIEFDAERWKLLDGLDVQQHIGKNLKRFSEITPQPQS